MSSQIGTHSRTIGPTQETPLPKSGWEEPNTLSPSTSQGPDPGSQRPLLPSCKGHNGCPCPNPTHLLHEEGVDILSFRQEVLPAEASLPP